MSQTEQSSLLLSEASKQRLNVPKSIFILCGQMLGTGIITIAHCVTCTGLVGIAILVICNLMGVYCGVKLAKCWEMVMEIDRNYENHVRDPYLVIALMSYGKVARFVTRLCLIFLNIGATIALLIISAVMISDFLPISFCYWIVILGVIILPLSWLGTPKDIWWVEMISTFASLLCAVVVVYSISTNSLDTFENPDCNNSYMNIAYVTGVIFFCVAGASSFPTIQNDMENKEKFASSVFIANISCLAVYLAISIFTYIFISDDVNANIIISITNKPLKIMTEILMSLHCLMAISMIINPVFQDFENVLKLSKAFSWKRVLVRSTIIFVCILIAEIIPKFDLILNILGGSCVAFLSIIFPAMFFLKLNSKLISRGTTIWKSNIWEKFLLILVILIVTVIAIIVTINAAVTLIDNISSFQSCF